MSNERIDENEGWSNLPLDEKRRLFLKQKELLDTFRSTNMISKDQYEKSLGDLREKMGIKDE